MISVCLPSDALLQNLPSYLGFSYLGCKVSLHGCSSKAQLLFLSLDEGYLLTAAPPDLELGVAPLGPPAPMQASLLGRGVAPLGRACALSWPPALGQHSLDHQKSNRVPEKHLLLLHWLHQNLGLCGSQQTVENSSRDGNTRPPDLTPDKSVCRSRRNH